MHHRHRALNDSSDRILQVGAGAYFWGGKGEKEGEGGSARQFRPALSREGKEFARGWTGDIPI